MFPEPDRGDPRLPESAPKVPALATCVFRQHRSCATQHWALTAGRLGPSWQSSKRRLPGGIRSIL
eukprot:15459277-Alexandrium_andersonii.AAC.1